MDCHKPMQSWQAAVFWKRVMSGHVVLSALDMLRLSCLSVSRHSLWQTGRRSYKGLGAVPSKIGARMGLGSQMADV